MKEINGVELSLVKWIKSLYVKAEFSPEQWKKIPELTDNGISVFFKQFVPEYFHKNEIDNNKRIIWSPLIYDYTVYTNLYEYKYHELPESLQMLHNVCDGFRHDVAIEYEFNLLNYLLFSYQTPFGGHFGLRNSQKQPIAMRHYIYQSACGDDPIYDMPDDNSIAIDVCDKLLLEKNNGLCAFDAYMSDIGFNTRWGDDYDFSDEPLKFAVDLRLLADPKFRTNWPGWNLTKKQKTL